jgi:hypothetical protein
VISSVDMMGREVGMVLTRQQEELCETSQSGFSDLGAVFLNCAQKTLPERSHTEGLIRTSRETMERNGVATVTLRVVDCDIASGVYSDITRHG